mmetsp:Transcript_26035/g.51941  ORF Transcript_26035/g.51941 Transcript_26035/m.51941 type:complete len:406 (-) Transcript_26035:25-1242(-)
MKLWCISAPSRLLILVLVIAPEVASFFLPSSWSSPAPNPGVPFGALQSTPAGASRLPFSTFQSKQPAGAVRLPLSALHSAETSFETSPLANPLPRTYRHFLYKSFKINYDVSSTDPTRPPILLIHGFGGSINHWRYNAPYLHSLGYNVVRVDLLGFGASDKPAPSPSVEYCMELFEDVCYSLVEHVEGVGEVERGAEWIVGGNSIGGLTSLLLGRRLGHARCPGVVLFNASGGMTSFRYSELSPLLRPVLWLVQNVVLGQFGTAFWNNFKQPSNVENILRTQVYKNNDTNVDEQLLDIILAPSYDEGAREVFLAVFGGQAGPTPEEVIGGFEAGQKVLALWGTGDLWTPLETGLHPGAEFGRYAPEGVEYELVRLDGVGHCPMDENPGLCHEALGPWLRGVRALP